ncbi:siderophore-interacting protein [Solwaraspora sp. WMMD792]|uniref:siderophore-interacting protein n=1 Tax=Solwaraspora sp. WMMD792 TaxID=3016099 RepID=UPI0024162B03|nr:siderophore-interacting protein [Solwaraspora sp. WMMD792]MDG4772992.1 siderophore-interacting protein [Solwaraspora sp. WMMD792]
MSGVSLGMIGKYRRPAQRRMLALSVLEQERISPHFVSVTLGGDDFAHLEQSGYDQFGRLFFSPPGQAEATLPTSDKWMRQYALLPARRRPRTRMYSIRRFRPEISAFDIEVAVHEEAGGGPSAPGTAWALAAKPGDRVTFLDEGYCYQPTHAATWQLLVGDESALPAILAILDSAGPTLPTEVFVEVPTSADIRHDVTVPAGTTMHWLPRDDPDRKPGALALPAVRDATLPSGPSYTWTAGESALATGLRRHLVTDRGVPKSDIAFVGYWKHGHASL